MIKSRNPLRPTTKAGPDAIALLKADHRQVAEWFKAYAHTSSETRKAKLANQICSALKVHTRIEEEIFYPAFIEATQDTDIHHEAVVEHAGAKHLIAQIDLSSPGDDYFDAQIKVLSELIKHHVKEEEQPGGMFAKARKSAMDLEASGSAAGPAKEGTDGQCQARADTCRHCRWHGVVRHDLIGGGGCSPGSQLRCRDEHSRRPAWCWRPRMGLIAPAAKQQPTPSLPREA